MKVLVLNAQDHLSILRGKADFENAKISDADNLSRILQKYDTPFVLLWHMSPNPGLNYLLQLEERNELSGEYRGGVFFRGEKYAGLTTPESAQRCIEVNGFTNDTIHIVSSAVSKSFPDRNVLENFNNFTNSVLKLAGDEPLPFQLLEPLPSDLKEESLKSLIGLTAQLWKNQKLPPSQLTRSLDWSAIKRDFPMNCREQIMLSWDDNYKITEAEIDRLSKESTGRWNCDLCEKRYSITHTQFLRLLISNSELYLIKQNIELETIKEIAIECVRKLKNALNLTNCNPLLLNVTERLDNYLKSSENTLSLAPVVHEILSKKCSLYVSREQLLKHSEDLSEAAMQLAKTITFQQASSIVKKIILESKNLISLLTCANTNAHYEVYLP